MKQALKEKTIISTREFTRQFARLTQRPTARQYLVVNHGKVVGAFTPQPPSDGVWWSGLEEELPLNEPKNTLTLKELRKKYSFRSGVTNLSQRVDEIVYGIKR